MYLEGSEQFPPLGGGGSLEYRSNSAAVHSTTNPFPDIAGIAGDGYIYREAGWMFLMFMLPSVQEVVTHFI